MDDVQARRLVDTYADMILRISFAYLKQVCDAEDICQTVFLNYLSRERGFESAAHEKAWIIRAAVNACKDRLKRASFRRDVPLETAEGVCVPPPDMDAAALLDALRSLPEKYGLSLYLYYYEGYSTREIAAALGKNENTVAAYLSRGRKRLRAALAEDGEGVFDT